MYSNSSTVYSRFMALSTSLFPDYNSYNPPPMGINRAYLDWDMQE